MNPILKYEPALSKSDFRMDRFLIFYAIDNHVINFVND